MNRRRRSYSSWRSTTALTSTGLHGAGVLPQAWRRPFPTVENHLRPAKNASPWRVVQPWGLENRSHVTPLYAAAMEGRVENAATLLRAGCNTDNGDKLGTSPVYIATQDGGLGHGWQGHFLAAFSFSLGMIRI
jgi:hypothetical protein